MSAERSDKTRARLLALAMHALFILLIVFGVSWQKKSPPAVEAELWSNLPPLPQQKTEPAPEPEPAPPPPPRVAPPPEPQTTQVPLKPDIAIKKAEKEKPLPKAAPKPEVKDTPKPEPKKREEDLAKLETKLETKLEKERLEKEKSETLAKAEAQEKLAAQKRAAEAQAAASADSKLVEEYKQRIVAKVRQNLIEPPGLQGSPTAEFDVVIIPGGDVLNIKLARSSGVPAYDAAVESAIRRAAPLPLPPNPELFQRFRDLHLLVRPK